MGVYIYIWVYSVQFSHSVVSDSLQPHRQQPTRLLHPWEFPGKSTGVGCHCLLQCMKVKSEREVTQSCPTLSDPMDCSPPGSSIHGIFQARVLEWVAIAFSGIFSTHTQIHVHTQHAYIDTTFNHPFHLRIKTAFTHNHATPTDTDTHRHTDTHVPLTNMYSVVFVCCRH